MLELIKDFWVAEQFACAIEYGDVSGISDEDDAKLDEWISGQAHKFDVPVIDVEAGIEFRKCEITGLDSNCIHLRIYRDLEKFGLQRQ